ncbi:hypothetical protein [Sulfuriroseicoccus oceanibius]|uniref:Uncharacterized protein n=1 Tax=Sulfuriroseicoccus oceanibius TaxID=2707525 RepID=A0A6B3LB33_9BACT|nr:hypothetical protein [Sulfuriroseicoccus oceanibius]QQL45438.1 hypothetical protein G3M56_002265 [Sulfuriroseicoccus oceanibius]
MKSVRSVASSCLALSALLSAAPPLLANEVPAVESYVLATDREAELAKLVPGTVDYYRLHLIHFENTGQWGKQEAMIADMRAQMKRGALSGIGESELQTFELRRAVMRFQDDTAASGASIARILGLSLSHSQPLRENEQSLPSALHGGVFERRQWLRSALKASGNSLRNVSDHQLPYLLSERIQLTAEQREQFLRRYQNAQSPGVVDLVVAHFTDKRTASWGEFEIHQFLTLEQMDKVRKRVTRLRDDSRFTAAYLSKLMPGDDVELWVDRDETMAYLERVWAYVSTLPENQNALRGQVLYRLLEWERMTGRVNREHLQEYLKLPRPVAYQTRELRRNRQPMTFGNEFTQISGVRQILPPVEEELVRELVMDQLVADGNDAAFRGLILEKTLQQWLAEAMIVAGKGERDRWSRVLGPDQFTALRDRVDIDFAPTNPARFAVDEPVSLEVMTKNAGAMEVKIYQINTLAFHEQNAGEIDGTLDLDGLVANHSRVIETGDNPFVRKPLRVELPEIDGRGVWVVEMIGNGRSNRAIVRRGDLRVVTQPHPLGQQALVLDESGKPFAGAEVRLGGHVFPADENGLCVLPFSENEEALDVVLHDPMSGLARPAKVDAVREEYVLDVSHVVPRESLIAGKETTLAVRWTALLNGQPVNPEQLVRPKLSLRLVDADGVASVKRVPVESLQFYRDLTIDFVVPERLVSLEVVLSAEVEQVRTGEMVTLEARSHQEVNDGAATDAEGFVYWLPTEKGLVAELRGRNGELLAGHDVRVSVRDEQFQAVGNQLMRSDERGRVMLGGVPRWAVVEISGAGRGKDMVSSRAVQRFVQSNDDRVMLGVDGVTLKAGEARAVPMTVTAADLEQRRVSLVEIRRGAVVRDVTDQLTLTDGGLVIGSGLAAGSYELRTESDQFAVEVVDGDWHGLWLLGERIAVRDPHQTLPRLTQAEVAGDAVKVQVADASDRTRLYVVASRYRSDQLRRPGMGIFPMNFDQLVTSFRGAPTTDLLGGRRISDEYRYVLERRLAKHFPGNLLGRPELILNPWDVDQASAKDRNFKPGDDLKKGAAKPLMSRRRNKLDRGRVSYDAFSSEASVIAHPVYDFLADQPGFLISVPLDENGGASINLKNLPEGRDALRIVVVDDGVVIDRNLVTGDAAEPALCDRRTQPVKDASLALALEDSVTAVPAGGTLELQKQEGTRVARIATVDDLAGFFDSVGDLPDWRKFSFVRNWQKLGDDDKRERYDDFACHGLHLFLAKYDPEFFNAVVKPGLESKLEKSLVDEFLLGRDLTGYLAPQVYQTLNALELALLARGLPQGADRDSVAADLATRASMLPPNPVERTEWVLTALGTSMGGAEGDPFASDKSEEPEVAAGGGSFGRREGVLGFSMMDEDSFADNRDAPAAPSAALEPQPEGMDIMKEKQRQLYRELGLTKIYAESNYYRVRRAAQGPGLIPVNPFWAALGAWDGDAAFASSEIVRQPVNVSEALAMLAFSGLPLEAEEAEVESSDTASKLTAKSPLIVVSRQTVPAKKQDAQAGQMIWMDHQVFRADDRFVIVNGQREPKAVGDTLETGIAYGMTVSPMNMSGRDLVVDLHSVIPSGAVPLQNGQAMIGGSLFLGHFESTTREVQFYFPEAGTFTMPAAQVTSDGVLLVSSAPRTFEVVEKIDQVDKTSWPWIAAYGSNAEVLEFLKNENLHVVGLPAVAWRMKDKAFFKQVTDLLRSRRMFDAQLWAYGVKHGDVVTTGELLSMNQRASQMFYPFLDSDVVDYDPIERGQFEHLDFRPFVNARAHQLGGKAWIGNDKMHGQYTRMLEILARKAEFDAGDRLRVSYYLLMQDRIDEGLTWFDSIDRDAVDAKMQYDYLACYAAFFRSEPEQAKAIASHYAGTAGDHWRDKFAQVVAQADEIASGVTAEGAGDSREATHEREASAEVTLALRQAGPGALELRHANADTVELAFYEVDLELLFSRTPFLNADSDRFRIVQPTQTMDVKLNQASGESTLAIPDALKGRNLLVEVRAGGKSVHAMVSDHRMNVAVAENYGLVTVRGQQNGKPVPAAYVKVYARMKNGQVEFYKDGYTDLRGKFDYSSLNEDKLPGVERFALLIADDELGTTIREVAPPAR